MDYVQALFSFFIAPLFGTVILGMLWKRATQLGRLLGLLAGTVSSVSMWIYTSFGRRSTSAQALRSHRSRRTDPRSRWRTTSLRALWSWFICVVVTVVVSYMTKPRPEAELTGLVYGATVIPHDGATTIWQKPIFWACHRRHRFRSSSTSVFW